MRFAVSLLFLAIAVAGAAAARARLSTGILGRRQAYGRLMSDWAGLTLFGLGAGLAALIAGLRLLAWFLIVAVAVESFMTLRAVRPKRQRG